MRKCIKINYFQVAVFVTRTSIVRIWCSPQN